MDTQEMSTYMSADDNVLDAVMLSGNPDREPMCALIAGLHGVGKTARVKQAAARAGLKLAVLTAPTTDVWTDIKGVLHQGELIRMDHGALEEAEVLFADEVNASSPELEPAWLELIGNGSINGKRLPNLRLVIGAMNPTDLYTHAGDLSEALMSRFKIKMRMDPDYSAKALGSGNPEEIHTKVSEYLAGVPSLGNPDSLAEYVAPRDISAHCELWLGAGTRSLAFHTMSGTARRRLNVKQLVKTLDGVETKVGWGMNVPSVEELITMDSQQASTLAEQLNTSKDIVLHKSIASRLSAIPEPFQGKITLAIHPEAWKS